MTIDLRRIWALVPLRGLEDAKTRLGAELDAEERLELVVTMASRTLAAARDARTLAGTVLVTADPEAARLATSFGARTLVQRLPGLNAAIREARAVAIEAGATAVIVLPIDLPSITPAAIDTVVELAGAAAGAAADGDEAGRGSRPARHPAALVAAVPDRHGAGTNALLVAPPGAIEPAFGERSLQAHRAAAARAGARWLELGGPLTADVDTGADLIAAERGAGGGRGAA